MTSGRTLRHRAGVETRARRTGTATATRSRAPLAPHQEALLDLQRTGGNRAVQRAVQSGATVQFPVPAGARPKAVPPPGAHFRVPRFADLEATYKSATIAIPEKTIKDRMVVILARMARENRLKIKRDDTKDSVKESWRIAWAAVHKIFPGGGTIDEAAFNEILDANDRTVIYNTVMDAEAEVKAEDVKKLARAFEQAAKLSETAATMTTAQKQVFGSKQSIAKAQYEKAATRLRETSAKLGTDDVTTDYNRDDPEVSLGGWAHFPTQHMHLDPDVVKVRSWKNTAITLIHEAAHLTDGTINDDGNYYGSAGFESADEDTKITNAAHFEELPRRWLGKSRYGKVEFTPGVAAGGGAPTFEQKVQGRADGYLRMAWDRAVDLFSFIRSVRRAQLRGDRSPFTTSEVEIIALSKKLGLTIHEQKAGNREVTSIDVTLAEGVARAMAVLGQVMYSRPVDASLTEDEAFEKLLNDSVQHYGVLRGDDKAARARVDFLKAGYKGPIP